MTSPAVLEALPLAAAQLIETRELEQTAPRWVPMTHQVPPGGDWDSWLLLAGRGAGKTDACAHYVDQAARAAVIRIGIIAPTLGDAIDACVTGPSGLKAHNPAVKLTTGVGGTYVVWPNGSRAKLFGAYTAEDVERLRAGGNRHLDWYEEFAAWRNGEEAHKQARFGLRLGEHPHRVASTTPKPRKHLKDLMARPGTAVTRATTDDNPHLDARVRADLYDEYAGTRLGRQELGGELIDDVEGALWTREQLELLRALAAPALRRVVVGVDPAGSSHKDSDLTGIVVVAKGEDGHGYVLADRTCKKSPAGWATVAVDAYQDFGADRIIGEQNNGGEMVEHTIRSIDQKVSYRGVHASRGKRVRAEPIAALYERGKIHHVGAFPELEDQMCNFTQDGYDGSPDRLDALVWALSELMLEPDKKRLRVLS